MLQLVAGRKPAEARHLRERVKPHRGNPQDSVFAGSTISSSTMGRAAILAQNASIFGRLRSRLLLGRIGGATGV